jgi:2-keto-4-pentenoate hydratase/2-oxohepta-3-ene-1,7-dioic acid hydratase in catechol pathway
MKLISFYAADGVRLGIKTEAGIVDVRAAAAKVNLPVPQTITDVIVGGAQALDQLEHLLAVAHETVSEAGLRHAPAVPAPSKMLFVGANYRRHAVESKLPIPQHPVYFSKYANSLAAHGEDVVLPLATQQGDYEVELVVVIGRRANKVTTADALNYVFGYATGNDLSARDLQFRNSQWLYGKAINGFAPLGPYLVTADEVPNPQGLNLKCWLNGELRQNSNTEDMIFSVAELISDLSQVMALEPGDVIYTGTPEGVILGMEHKRWLQPGDEVVCEVEGLGRLVNRLVADSSAE